MRKFLFWLTARMPCRLIDIDGKPYLERYYVGKLFGITFYLHRFVAADGDRDVHDHPWGRAAALLLCGGYTEERLQWFDIDGGWLAVDRELRPLRLNWIGARVFHRIAKAEPETWTLFMHGKRVKKWGFLHHAHQEDTVVYHQPYNVAATKNWETTMPLGKDSKRQPLV